MENSNSGLTAADVLALTNNNDVMGGNGFWWIIIFFIIAGMFNGNGFGFGNNNTATTDFVANQFSNQNDKFLSLHNTDAISQTNRDVLETSFATAKEVLENRYNNALQTNQLQSQMSNEAYTLYLTYNGEAIWNLSESDYVLQLEKGTTANYGLRISARKTPTGIDEAVVDAQGNIRKVLVNDKVFIIRGEKVYTIDGQLVK